MQKNQPGRLIVIEGLEGAGKSTAMRTICLLYTSPSPRD